MIALVLYWPKKLITVGATAIAEIAGDEFAILHAGHAMAEMDLRVDEDSILYWPFLNGGLGRKAALNKVKKYSEEAVRNFEAFNSGDRDALLAHRKSVVFKRGEIGTVTLLNKKGMMDPGLALNDGIGLIDWRSEKGRWRMALKSGTRADTQAWTEAIRAFAG